MTPQPDRLVQCPDCSEYGAAWLCEHWFNADACVWCPEVAG